jgi:DNA-binding SARP family transcriptional activator/tetratricopeptide (TPR) repeat protein
MRLARVAARSLIWAGIENPGWNRKSGPDIEVRGKPVCSVAVLAIQVLGPLRVRRGDTEVETGSPQQQAMLAALLLRPRYAAATDELIDAIWGEQPPNKALSILRTYAWRWRRALAEDCAGGPSADVLVSQPGGYRLELPEEAVDARHAESLAAAAERARAAGRPEQARDLLAEAVARWHGVPLAGVPGPYAERQRRRLAEVRLGLLEQRIELDVALGRAGSCVPELQSLVEDHPLREQLYVLLIRALSRSGRQGEALGVFTDARRVLIDELGVEPGPELRSAQAEVLAATCEISTLTAPEPVMPGTGTGTGTVRSPRPAQLPPDEADFVGREHTIARLLTELTAPERTVPPVISIAGMGGVGKSTLALHLAHRARAAYPDGQLYADLHGTGRTPAGPRTVLAMFLRALGVRDDDIPADIADRTALFRSLLDGRRVLIVLDDAADASQIRPLLPGTVGCAVLVTSRARPAAIWRTAQVWLDVFDEAEAHALLIRVAGPERPAAEGEAARRLADACGRLPLAVRIVAARLAARPAWSLTTLAARLAAGRRLPELAIGEFAVAPAFEVGYRQLTASQAEAFRLLGVLETPEIGLAAAAAVLAVPRADAEHVLESLVDLAMVESPAEHRYRHHSLLKEFARTVAAPDGAADETATAHSRLLAFLLAGACAAFERAVPADPIRETLDRFDADSSTDASAAAEDMASIEFATTAEAREWVRTEADSVTAVTTWVAREALHQAQAPLLPGAINLMLALSPFTSAADGCWAAPVAELARAAAHHRVLRGQARTGFLLGNAALLSGRLEEAERICRDALDVSERAGDTVISRQIWNDLGVIAHARARFDEAAECFGKAVALAQELGHRSGELASRLNAAAADIRAGRTAEVLADCAGMLADARDLGDDAAVAQTRYVAGLALAAEGRNAEAAMCFQDAVDGWTPLEAHDRAVRARFHLAKTLRVLGAADQAEAQARIVLEQFEATGRPADREAVRGFLAELHAERD